MLLDEAPAISVPSTDATQKGMTVICHSLMDALDDLAIRQTWLSIHARDPQAFLAQHPDGVAVALKNGTGWLPGLLLEAEVDGVCVGFAIMLPKQTTSRRAGGFGPEWRINGYLLAGTDVLGESREAVRKPLLEEAARQLLTRKASFLLMEDLEVNSPVWQQAQELKSTGCCLFSPTGWQERLRINMPETADEYWSKFSGKTRNGFRRKSKKLGETTVRKFCSANELADFLSLANQVSLNTWQSDQLGLRVRNDDAELEHYTFRANHGAFRSYVLMHGEKPIAFLIGKQYRGKFIYEEVGYDREFALHSPGQTLLIEVLNDLFADDRPKSFDFGGGEADYKRMFANDITQSATIWLVPPQLCPQITSMWLKLCREARKGVRSVLRRSGWLTRLRQALRRKSAPVNELPLP